MPSSTDRWVGRLAPSPTGAQHLGNARTFLLAWWLIRKTNGTLYLRIEDLDTPRIKTWATAQLLEDLRWLGIDWDDSPLAQTKNVHEREEIVIQSHRTARYEEILQHLKEEEAIYPCTCTRSDIESSLSAPHETSNHSNLDGAVYPGTCSQRVARDALELDRQGRKYAWRFRLPSQPRTWNDLFAGPQELQNPHHLLGDFVIARSNGAAAYQLAVVVDDHDMSVNQVVRGADLIYSTYRQLSLYEQLNWPSPIHCHFPLVVGEDGMRLAKRHGDTRLSYFREQSVTPEKIVGYLAYYSGWIDRLEAICARDLLSIDLLDRQHSRELVVTKDSYADFFTRS